MNQAKELLRQEMFSRIRAQHPSDIDESNAAILKNLLSLPEFIAAARVFTYVSIGREPDTRAVIDFCLSAGKTVAVPADMKNGDMRFALLDKPLSALAAGVFGIPIPEDIAPRCHAEKGDIVLVPALCYDRDFYRLGRGGGYYDQYLASCQAFSVGLCREAFLLPELPHEAHDMPVSCLVTDKRIARPK